jgi:hypothetical protein
VSHSCDILEQVKQANCYPGPGAGDSLLRSMRETVGTFSVLLLGSYTVCVCVCVCVCLVLGFELRAACVLPMHSTT